jgi:DNA-dependent RNA polymerase
VHDCFAALPHEISQIENLVKEAFIKIYFTEGYLTKLHQNLLDQINAYYPLKYEGNQCFIIFEDSNLEERKLFLNYREAKIKIMLNYKSCL